jgi:hypothetical protein
MEATVSDRAEETANASMSTTSAPPPREPGPKTKARADEARLRNEQRHARAQVAFKMTGDELTIGPAHDDLIWKETVLDAFGTSSRAFANREISRLLESLRGTGQRHAPQDDVNAALAAVDGTRPENEMAAMLAGQMAVTHALAMDMLSRTKRAGFIDEMHAYGALATKLLRTYTMQTEALAKLKRGGEQTVRVEHVYVYPGGQAIVGAVSTQRAEGGVADERGNQADGAIDARAIAFAPGAALFGPDAGRDALPEGRGDRQEALPHARRGKRQRRASR